MSHQQQQQQQMGMTLQPGYQGGGTTVIVNQPQMMRGPVLRGWRTGLCGCCDDCGICLCVYFCSLCAACQISQDMGESMCIPCCVPNFMIPLRTKLRTQLGIQGSICDDCLVTTCCPQCALCQLMREHKYARQSGEL